MGKFSLVKATVTWSTMKSAERRASILELSFQPVQRILEHQIESKKGLGVDLVYKYGRNMDGTIPLPGAEPVLSTTMPTTAGTKKASTATTKLVAGMEQRAAAQGTTAESMTALTARHVCKDKKCVNFDRQKKVERKEKKDSATPNPFGGTTESSKHPAQYAPLGADLEERLPSRPARRGGKWYWNLAEEVHDGPWNDLKAAFLAEFGTATRQLASIVEFLETVQGVRQAGRPIAHDVMLTASSTELDESYQGMEITDLEAPIGCTQDGQDLSMSDFVAAPPEPIPTRGNRRKPRTGPVGDWASEDEAQRSDDQHNKDFRTEHQRKRKSKQKASKRKLFTDHRISYLAYY
ncbi:hypothetical protein MMC07_002911 [Pseudocyphellaria aurata]|nr:hypothetical protein [Pseudocyphellaria aurata]